MDGTREYLKEIKTKFNLAQIEDLFSKLQNLKVLVIGDTILDHYVFVAPKGRAIKDPILSVEYKNREIYAGGVLVLANHLSSFVKEINLVTLIGDQNPMLDFINQSLKNNVSLKTFIKKNSPTTVKKRIIDNYRFNKLFKIEYINDAPVDKELTDMIVAYLDETIPKYDLVVVIDFGHGFINEAIRRKLEEKSKFLALNVQSNSANMGYNYFTLYKKYNFISMSEDELRLPLYRRFEDIDKVINEAYNTFHFDKFIVTLGKKGSIFVNEGSLFKAPIVIESVKDTMGAGDALFTIAALLTYVKADNKLIPFIANCAGGMHANVMGNKESITKENILKFIRGVFNE